MKITQKELLERVKDAGVAMTENTFRKLIRYGLILSKKEGHKRGVRPDTFYFAFDVESVLELYALKQTYRATSWEHMIFLHFYKGYPFHTEKLQDQLVEFIDSMNKTFKNISSNPKDVEKAISKLTDKVNPHSKRTQAEGEAKQHYELIIQMITDISHAKGIPSVHLLTFLNRLHIFGLPDFQEIFKELFGQFELSKLRKSVLASRDTDFYRIQQIIIHSLSLWSEISAIYPDTKQIPWIGKLLIKLQDHYKMTDLFSKPEFLQLALILLLHLSNKRILELHKCVLNPTTRRRIIISLRYIRLFSIHSGHQNEGDKMKKVHIHLARKRVKLVLPSWLALVMFVAVTIIFWK